MHGINEDHEWGGSCGKLDSEMASNVFSMVLWRHKVGHQVREDIYASERNVPMVHFYAKEGQSDLSQIPDRLEKSIYCLYQRF